MRELLRPDRLDAAIEALDRPDAAVLAGGTATVPLMRAHLLDIETLVWLGAVPGLRGARAETEHVAVGAMTPVADVAASSAVRVEHRAVAESAASIGNVRVRNQATLGGALVHADPRQDLPPALIVSRATVVAVGPDGERLIPVEHLFTGFLETSLLSREIVTEVRLPHPVAGSRSGYLRFTPGSADDFPTVSVAASVTVRADGTVADARVAVGAAGPTPLLVEQAGEVLRDRPLERHVLSDVADVIHEAVAPLPDRLGSSSYKRAMAALCAARLLTILSRWDEP